MCSSPQDPRLSWRDGTLPVSGRFDDLYYSETDGLAETRYVYLDGNRLADRMAARTDFRVAELGFGTGLGFLAAWELWDRITAPKAVLTFASFELAPLSKPEMAMAHSRWPELAGRSQRLLSALQPAGFGMAADLGSARLELHIGDARQAVPRWSGSADAWFLDGFAPARNPEMWEPGLLRAVAQRTSLLGTAASFTAAGAVRRALSDAGFDVWRRKGFGTKRHMLCAQLATCVGTERPPGQIST